MPSGPNPLHHPLHEEDRMIPDCLYVSLIGNDNEDQGTVPETSGNSGCGGESYEDPMIREGIRSLRFQEIDDRRDECSRRDSNPGNELGRLRS